MELCIFSEMRTLVLSEEDVPVSVSIKPKIISFGSCLCPMWGDTRVVEERLEGREAPDGALVQLKNQTQSSQGRRPGGGQDKGPSP